MEGGWCCVCRWRRGRRRGSKSRIPNCIHTIRQIRTGNREAYICAPGIIIGVGIGFISGDGFGTCSAPLKGVGSGEYLTTSSTEPKLFLSDRRSSTIFLNDGRIAGSLSQQAWSNSRRAGVLNRESGMVGRILSSKRQKQN